MNDLLAGLNVRALFLAGGVLCVWLAYQFVAKRLTNEERLKEATSNIRWVIEDARRMRREVEKQHSIIELVRMLDLYNLQKSELDAKQQNQQKSLINSLEDLSPDSVHTKLRILIDEAKAEVTRVGALQQSEAANQQRKVITVLDSFSSAIDPTAAQLAELRRLIDEAKAEVTRVGAQQSEAATNQQKNVITSLDSLSSAIHPTVNQLRRLIDGAKAWVKRHAAEELSISQLALGRYRGQVLQHQQANAQTDQPPQQSATELQNTMITSLETLGSAIDIANTELESIKKNREPWRYYLAAVGVLFMAAFLFFCSAFFGKDGLRGLF
jgi:hypothetical protein